MPVISHMAIPIAMAFTQGDVLFCYSYDTAAVLQFYDILLPVM